jgi:hypothetical protein
MSSSSGSPPSSPPDPAGPAPAAPESREGGNGQLRWLPDAWAPRGGLWLDGALEQTSFGPRALSLFTGLMGLAVAFVAFQFLVSPVVLLAQIGMDGLRSMGDPGALLASYTRELIVSNSLGQILGLAVPTLLFARLHASRVADYLRLRLPSARLLGLSVLGLLALQPVTQWLAALNRRLPMPEAFRAIDQAQLELIEKVLQSDLGVGFNVIMLALVPGICEEVLFRGYAQRQFERGTGTVVGIVLSGLLFGMYHLRPSQLLPLAMLGLYFAYLTWRTGSALPAMIVHFAHNALSVVVANVLAESPDYEVSMMEGVGTPWYLVLAGFVFFAGVVYVLHQRARRERPADP